MGKFREVNKFQFDDEIMIELWKERERNKSTYPIIGKCDVCHESFSKKEFSQKRCDSCKELAKKIMKEMDGE